MWLLWNRNVTLFVTFYTKNPPQTTLRGIFVEHRRNELTIQCPLEIVNSTMCNAYTGI